MPVAFHLHGAVTQYPSDATSSTAQEKEGGLAGAATTFLCDGSNRTGAERSMIASGLPD